MQIGPDSSHLAALPCVRTFTEIRAWSTTAANLERFVAEAPAPVRAARTAEKAVHGADVVVLATNAVTPAIQDRWVSPGTHVIAIGACRLSQQEIDPALVARANLVVDSKAAALVESGDIVLPIREGRFTKDHVRAELGEIVSGLKTRPLQRERNHALQIAGAGHRRPGGRRPGLPPRAGCAATARN